MRDVVSSHESSQQVGDSTGLATVRPKSECVHPPLSGGHRTNVLSEEQLEGKASQPNSDDLKRGGEERRCLTCGAG